MNAKSYIRNLINRFTGLTEANLKIEALNNLLEEQARLVGKLHIALDRACADLVTESQVNNIVEEACENFVTERNLNDAVEEAFNDQDWDSIVSDALGERRTSAAFEEAVEEAMQNAFGERAFSEAVLEVVQQDLQDEDGTLAQEIKDAINNLPKA